MKTRKTENSDPLLTRRQILITGATGLVTLVGLSGLGSRRTGQVYADTTAISTPALEEGPYWVDETGTAFHRSDLRANVDGTNVQAGLPLHYGLTVSQLDPTTGAVTPLPNVFVYIWSASALGVYSDEAVEDSTADTYLRGYQVTNAHGNVQFLTIYPGWYGGRTIHIHMRVRLYPNNDPTQTPTYDYETQVFFDDTISDSLMANVSPYNQRQNRDTYNATDRVYQGGSLDDDGVTSDAGAVTTLRLADDTTYAMASFHLLLNLSLAETTGTSGGGGGTGGPGGGGPGGGGPGAGGPP